MRIFNKKIKPRPKGIKKRVRDQHGKRKTIRLYKHVPKKCSVPRQICIRCRVNRIPKLMRKQYEAKVCRDCEIISQKTHGYDLVKATGPCTK